MENKIVTYKSLSGDLITIDEKAINDVIKKGNNYITDSEVNMFIQLCKNLKLNPFTRDAYLVKYQSSKPADMVIAKDAMQKNADMHPQYDGQQEGIVVVDKQGNEKDIIGAITPNGTTLIGGWCKVYRKDRRFPTEIRVSFKEYNKGQSTWNLMPATMIRKVAIAQALRQAFPNMFNGVYIEEEYDNMKNIIGNDNQEKPQTEEINVDDIFNQTIDPQENVFDADVEENVFEPQEEIPECFEEEQEENEWERIDYATYKNNKSAYEVDNSTYDKATYTIMARKKA